MDLDDALGDFASTDDSFTDRLGAMRSVNNDATSRLTRSVAKARIANALFASERRVDVGRYRLLERAGMGGMGVVWSAWDPELERRVAIKFVRATVKSSREQILREGQALAKLSHPNVVSVFDVGLIEDQVYLVMEWVRGATLRELCNGKHATRDVVQTYRQACAGLGAAHRAGVVHRDFKPDNAICGEDGRVRVLDFGLAGEIDARGIVGTPRYMAPEQAEGLAVTAAADQFAWCVSLREALVGDDGSRSIPSWIDAILARGAAVDPAARFPSMDALAAALERDPGRRWRRRGIVAVAVTTAVLAFAIGRSRSGDPPAPRCDDAATHLAAMWSPAARLAATDHIRGLGPFGAHEAERLIAELTSYGTSWASERKAACMAYNHGELPPVLYEQRLRCLGRSEAAFAAAIEVATEVTDDKLSRALIAARSLPSTAGCASEALLAVPPPPQGIARQVADVGAAVERARVLELAASPHAIDVANSAADAAQATGYAPLFARAALVQGWARAPSDLDSAHELLDRAFHAALRVGDDVLAVEAYARAWFVASRDADFNPSERERALVEDLAIRTGPPGRFSRALLYNNFAAERIVAGDRAGARDLLRKALDAWHPPLGDRAHDIELGAVLQNLALVEEDPARRVELGHRAVESLQLQLGPDHPATINARIQLALLTPDPVASTHAFDQTCGAIAAWHMQLNADCRYEEAWLAIERGDALRAQAAMSDARAAGNSRARSQIAAAYLEIVSGDRTRITAARDAMRVLSRKLSTAEGWWTHADAADAKIVQAFGERALGADAVSTPTLRAALDQLADQPVLERRRAWIQATLARRLIATNPIQARSYADAAIRWYRAASGYDTEIAKLQSLGGAPQ